MSGQGINFLGRIGHSFVVECWRRQNGVLRIAWTDHINNLVPNVGLNEMLARIYKATALTVTDFVGLTDGSPVFAAGDAMSSHVGWVEVTAYDEAVRQAFTPGAVAAQAVDNSASRAVFNISGSATIGGAFLTTSNTKGGATGILLGEGTLSNGDRLLQDGDLIRITLTATIASV